MEIDRTAQAAQVFQKLFGEASPATRQTYPEFQAILEKFIFW